MKIAVVGAGRLATNLAPSLKAAGCEVVEVWSRSRSSAEALASRVGCEAHWGQLDEVTADADIYLISVADSALQEVVRELHRGREQALFAHTAGSMSLSLFAEAGHERGAVFYPMQTFSKERAVDFSRVHFFLEASMADDMHILTQLAAQLSSPDNVHEMTSAERRNLHLAAVFACNFSNHCYAIADELLRASGLSFEVMLPLVEETVQKLHDLPPSQAQTGPAIRKDSNVIGMQRSMLLHHPQLLAVYDQLTKSIQQLAAEVQKR